VSAWRIGTSGFSYPHWRGVLYPEGLPRRRWLERYAEVFDTVELNVTFYRLPRETVFETWAGTVPEGFSFVLKLPRLVSHIRRLVGCRDLLEAFRDRVALLGPKAGPLLLQLPPSLPFEAGRLDDFLAQVPAELPPIAWEPRHRSFAHAEAATWFSARGQTLVLADSGGRYPTVRLASGPMLYLRFHGPGPLYASPYGAEGLEPFAGWAADNAAGRPIWAFFNNDVGGHAVRDALLLRGMVTPS